MRWLLHHEIVVIVLLDRLAELLDVLLGQVVLRRELLRQCIDVGVGVHLQHFLPVADNDLHVEAFDLAPGRAARRGAIVHLLGLLGGEAGADLQVLSLVIVISRDALLVERRGHILLVGQRIELTLVHKV